MDEFIRKLTELNENFHRMEESIRQTLERMHGALQEIMDLCRDQSTLGLSHLSPIHSSTPMNNDNEDGDVTFYEPAEHAKALVIATNSSKAINEPKERAKKNLIFEADVSKPAPCASKPDAPVCKPAPAVSKPAALAVSKPAYVPRQLSPNREVKAILHAQQEGKPLRRKLRKHMPGHTCSSCAKFYAHANLGMDVIQKCSRHRAWSVRPKTPEKFWYPGWVSPDKNNDNKPDEEELQEEKKPDKPDMTACRQM